LGKFVARSGSSSHVSKRGKIMDALLKAWTAMAHSEGEVQQIAVAVIAVYAELNARDRQIAALKQRIEKLEART
jgi:hypothetical protein